MTGSPVKPSTTSIASTPTGSTAIAYVRSGSREEAEDVLQDTYLKAWRSLQSGFRPQAPDAWLLHIARNLCISRHRARLRSASRPSRSRRSLWTTGSPGHRAMSCSRFRRRSPKLPELQRRAVVLREWRGLSYEEIAAELGLTYSAVATHISRGRRLLAAGLERSLASTLRGGSGFRVVIVGSLEDPARGKRDGDRRQSCRRRRGHWPRRHFELPRARRSHPWRRGGVPAPSADRSGRGTRRRRRPGAPPGFWFGGRYR